MTHAVLISEAQETCGVEEFARQSVRHLGARGRSVVLGNSTALADDVVINLPVLAWKKRLLAPIAAAARARARGQEVTVVLHEWADLALARRISYLPLLPLATRVLFSAPEVRQQFEATPVSRMVTRRRGIVPIPPNFAVPEWTRESALAGSLAADRAGGRMVIAQFGSIYPKKDPLQLLAIGAELMRRGLDFRLVFIGSFVGAAVQAEFEAEVRRLGLGERVEVSGYVADAAELYGLFAQVDVFVYPLSEGLTSRRASVLASAMSGRPVVVSAPARADSVTHHRLFRSLLRDGTIRLVPAGGGPAAFADAVMATRGTPPNAALDAAQTEAIWRDVVAVLEAETEPPAIGDIAGKGSFT